MHTTLQIQKPTTGIQRTSLDFAVIFMILLALTLVISGALWQFWHSNRIYTGVSIAGIPVGGLTRAEAINLLTPQLRDYPLPPISLTYADQRWPLSSEQIRTQPDLMNAINQAYLSGRQGVISDRLTAQWGFLWQGQDIAPSATSNPGQLRFAINQIASIVRRPARPASQIGDISIAARPGVDVDTEATLRTLLAALQENRGQALPITVPLSIVELLPSDAPTSTAQQGNLTADQEGESPLSINMLAPVSTLIVHDEANNLEMAIDASTLNRWVISSDPLQLDAQQLRSHLAQWAKQIEKPARDARLQFNPNTGTVSVIRTSALGQRLDIDATAASIHEALAIGEGKATLVITDIPPAVDMNRIDEMGIRELVASGGTQFAGSSAARVRNIEVAAEKFEGVVIPPGEIFSFNTIVEDVSSANGFEDSLIIWGDRTAVGVGGGVCQVSTTVFRAAYQAGLPIVERYNHGYIVSWYGDPGLDATIYTPQVDFRFRNDTGAYLLIDPVVDSAGGSIDFNLYGTKPDRQVLIDSPIVSQVTQPEAPVYRVDESLETGEREQVEWEKQGMTVALNRTIIESDGTERTDTMTSEYQPWRSVFLVGPGTEIPTAPTPEPHSREAEPTPPPDSP